MRDPQSAAAQRRHDPADQTQPLGRLDLPRSLEQQLHSEADPQQWPAFIDGAAEQVGEPELVDVVHGEREGADSGEHQPVGGRQATVIVGDLRLGADVLERLLDRAPVPHPVIDDRDPRTRGHVSVPFVLGTPGSVASIATAARSALAVALNAASIM